MSPIIRSRSTRKPLPALARSPIAAAVGLALAGGLPLVHAATASPKPGAALGEEFQVKASATLPAVARDAAGNFVVVWTGDDGNGGDIFAQRYGADGSPVGDEIDVNAHTAGAQTNPAVAMDAAGDFVVAWTDASGHDGDGKGVFWQHYNADGTIAGAEFSVNQHTSGDQADPSVAMDAAGDFVVAWTDASGEDGNGDGVFARQYSADGTSPDGEFPVNTVTSGNQGSPAVAMDAAGDFVVAWEEKYQIANIGIKARRFTKTGTPYQQFWAAHDDSVSLASASVAMDASGEFIVAWQTDQSDSDIFARRFDKNADPLGDANQVNTHTAGAQGLPTAAMDATGGFVIGWQDNSGEDGDGKGVFARRYDADGNPRRDQQTRLNTQTNGAQGVPAVAMDAAGDWVAAWVSQSGSDTHVAARRYARESSLDLEAVLTAAPDTVEPGDEITLTAAIKNNQPPVTLPDITTVSGHATIENALTTATGLTATTSLPTDISYNQATGTDWDCPNPPDKDGNLVCTYDAPLDAASLSEELTIQVKVPSSSDKTMTFSNSVFGDQPDAKRDNNSTHVDVAIKAGGDGGSSSGGSDGNGDSGSGDSGQSGGSSGGSGSGNGSGNGGHSGGAGSSGGGGGAFGFLGLVALGLPVLRRTSRRKS